MKVAFMSDLHIDFYIREKNPQSPKFTKQVMEYCNLIKLETDADVLIIPGDLGHYNQQDKEFLTICKRYYKHVILVRGNHDMYLVSPSLQKKYLKDSMNRVLEMKRWCSENDIHYLDGDIISIEGYNFGGVGMSWDKSFYERLEGKEVSDAVITEFFNNTMNDSKLIFGGSDNLRIPTAYGGTYFKSSFDHFNYFKSEYQKLQRINDFDNIDVMVTHYPPVQPPKMANDYGEDLSSTFYMFDGETDVKRISPKYWLFGHMHSTYDFEKHGTKFMCNPCGYPGEGLPTYVKVIEI